MGDGEIKRGVCSLGNDPKNLSRNCLCAIFMALKPLLHGKYFCIKYAKLSLTNFMCQILFKCKLENFRKIYYIKLKKIPNSYGLLVHEISQA